MRIKREWAETLFCPNPMFIWATEQLAKRVREKEIQRIIDDCPLLIALKYVRGGWGEWYCHGDELI